MPSPLALAFNLPFSEAIDAAKARGVVLPDKYYGELQGLARQLAFTASGLAGLDQVQAVKDSIDKAIAEGLSFGEWKKLAAVADLNLPAHRLDNLFRTNLQGQYLRGKWEQFDRNRDHRPYLMYDAINDSRVRPAHLAMDNVIRAIDAPWWKTHSPPNGFRCRCSILSLTADQAQARTGPDSGLNKQPVTPDHRPAEPDPGWDFNPYEDRLAGVRKSIADRRSQCAGLFQAAQLAGGKKRHNPPIWCGGPGADQLDIIAHSANYQLEMPAPRPGSLVVLPENLSNNEYLSRFMAEFGAAVDDQIVLESVTKHPLLISGEMFTNHKTGDSKITKHGREKYIVYLADTIKAPDEVWLKAGEYQDNALYFLSRYSMKSGIMNMLAVFIEARRVWAGWTGYQSFDWNYFKTKRDGYLIYRNERGG